MGAKAGGKRGRVERSICGRQVQPGADRGLPVVALHGMHVERRDGYKHKCTQCLYICSQYDFDAKFN
jgi:hypothetical protein